MKLLDGQTLDRVATRPLRQVIDQTEHAQDALLRRAEFLDPDDRLLITCAFKLGASQRRIAHLLQKPTGTVCRRLKKLVKLLADPHIVQLIDGPCELEPADRQIALGYFLRGQSLRQLSHLHGLTLRQVSRRVDFFKGWMKGKGEG